MHLSVRLPKVQPQEIESPTRCALPDPRNHKQKCSGTHFKAHEVNCRKPVRDTRYTRVTVRRYRCLKCQRSFRVYPTGVSRDQQSDTLKGLSVLLYVLGLSYQGVADLLDALEYPLAKSTVYQNVQAAGARARALRKDWRQHQAGAIPALSLDFTHVKCKGQDTIVAVATAVLTGQPLDFEVLQSESVLHAERWIRKLAQTIGAQVLVTDDADGLKTVAEDLGLDQQVCRAHVNRNVHDLIAAVGEKALEHPDPVPWELKPTQVTVEQFLEDLQTAESVIAELPFDGQQQLQNTNTTVFHHHSGTLLSSPLTHSMPLLGMYSHLPSSKRNPRNRQLDPLPPFMWRHAPSDSSRHPVQSRYTDPLIPGSVCLALAATRKRGP